MAPRKRRRNNISAPTDSPENAATWALPADLLLEILVRTDLFTIVHCAATCKLLRRDILSSPSIRHIAKQTAPCILTHLRSGDRPLTLVHPVTAAAASFCQDQLRAFMLRKAHKVLLGSYYPVTSRRGLVLLMSLGTNKRPKSKRSTDLCVYDPMTGRRTFLPKPTGIRGNDEGMENYVLLTAADGIGYSFMLFVADLCNRTIYVQTISSCSRSWRAVTTYPSNPQDFPWWSVDIYRAPAVLRGGIIHWLAFPGDLILTYDVVRRTMGKVKLPPDNRNRSELHLATSSDGNLLKLITIEGFTISVWLQPHIVPSDGGHGWSLENVIDMEERLHSLFPHISLGGGTGAVIRFEGSGQRTADVVLLKIAKKGCPDEYLVLDLEKNEMHTREWGFPLLEIDLPSHLQTMKMFS